MTNDKAREAFEAWFKPGRSGTDDLAMAKAFEAGYRAALSPASSTGQEADYVLMPRSLTAGNGAKAALSGEFAERTTHLCPSCGNGEDSEDCELCNSKGEVVEDVPVEWTTIKRIYAKAVEVCAAPQQTDAKPHAADARKLAEALRWTAAALQAIADTADVVTINGTRKTVGQILDEADGALAAPRDRVLDAASAKIRGRVSENSPLMQAHRKAEQEISAGGSNNGEDERG